MQTARSAALVATFLATATFFATPPLAAAPKWYLEMPPGAPSDGAARRTLALELEGVVVPPDPRRIGDTSDDVQFHISVTVDTDAVTDAGAASEWLLVRVWDRGELAGNKRVSAVGHPTTVGRRVALAAAELVRQLAAVRARNRRLEVKRQQESEVERKLERREAERRRLALQTGAEFVWATDGGWLAGPSLGIELNRELPWRFRSGVSILAGELEALRGQSGGVPLWSWYDVHAGGYFAKSFGERFEGEVGGVLALTLVDLAGGAEADAIPGQHTTWTARCGLDVGASMTLGPALRLRLGLGAGALLRRIPLEFEDQQSRFGGAYFAARISLLARRPWRDSLERSIR